MGGAQNIQESQKTEGDRVWDGEHFGPNGTIAVAFKKYELAFRNADYSTHTKGSAETKKEIALASMNYAMTLYSAVGNCVVRIKKFDFYFLFVLADILWSLKNVVSHIVQEKMYEKFDASQKEAFMAYLLVCRFISPFSGYRKLAIKLGEEVLNQMHVSQKISLADYVIRLLVMARLSRLWFYKERRECKDFVFIAINYSHSSLFSGDNIDWRTVNRLARLVGDEEMKKYSASLADSKDVMIKSEM